ncbi:MFS transporter [Actinoplanes sp. NBC_00393]|uniref:Cmx/CmrA family chloramphenicol efflux MFS transporter n=1 Tax=Actinoplanes sp. NBC_00393 TaxID=2975953 RepID=UPI002E1AD2A3
MPLALYLLALAVFAMGTSEFMLAGLVPDIAASLDVAVGTAGLLTSAFAVGMILGAPCMAAFTRRLPTRATLLGCVAVFAVCHVVAATTASFAVLFASRIVAAVANAGFLAVALSTATLLVAPNQKGRALAVLLSGTTIATVAGVPAGALLGTAWGWRATFWAVALLCVPAAVGILTGVRRRTQDAPERSRNAPSLAYEVAQLRAPRLLVAMLLAALLNGGTFTAFTFLAPLITGTAGLDPWWVPVALVLFGAGSFLGVTAAGRLADQHPRTTLVTAAPVLVLGWLLLALLAEHPVAVLVLMFAQGMLAFAAGSTLIARVLYAASDAPTMGGSYATAALNIGAAAGPALGAVALTGSSNLGPVRAAFALSTVALLLMLPTLRLIAPKDRSMEAVG